MANRFVGKNDLKQIDLGEGDWAKVQSKLSYGFVERFGNDVSDKEKIIKMLLFTIKEWNLIDPDTGNIAEINVENLRKLDMDITILILEEATKMISVPKVSRQESSEPSKADDTTLPPPTS